MRRTVTKSYVFHLHGVIFKGHFPFISFVFDIPPVSSFLSRVWVFIFSLLHVHLFEE